MVSSVVNFCFFMACCGVLIISGVKSNLNTDNGNDIFILYGSKDLNQHRMDNVIKNWERDDGESMFEPPTSTPKLAIRNAIASNRKHDNGITVYVPPNTNLGTPNPDQLSKEQLSDGEDIFNPEDVLLSQNAMKARVIRNYGRGETFRWYPRISEMNRPMYYYI